LEVANITSVIDTDVSISPAGSGHIVAGRGILMGGNNIGQVPNIESNSTLTFSTAGGDNNLPVRFSGNALTQVLSITAPTSQDLTLSTESSGNSIIAGKRLLMGGNPIQQAPSLNANGTLTFTTAAGANTSPVDFSGNALTNIKSLNGSGTLTLTTAAGANTSPVDFSNNAVTNIKTINGHNIYSYGNFSMNTTQTLSATNTATRVALDTTTSGASGLTLSSNRITIANAGTYNVNYRGYISRSAGNPTTWVWAQKNGTNIADSAVSISVSSTIPEGVLTKSTLFTFSAGDILDFFWAADATTAPLTYTAAITSPYARPASVAFGVMISIVA
jgi:hypothetical protein